MNRPPTPTLCVLHNDWRRRLVHVAEHLKLMSCRKELTDVPLNPSVIKRPLATKLHLGRDKLLLSQPLRVESGRTAWNRAAVTYGATNDVHARKATLPVAVNKIPSYKPLFKHRTNLLSSDGISP